MDMNKAFFLKNETYKPKWRVVDAQDQILGRLASKIAMMLRGKDKAAFTPQTISGDYIVVINAEKVGLSGDKLNNKKYATYSGWIGGYKEKTAKEIMQSHPERLIELAVSRMLPRNRSRKALLRRLKIYAGSEHPHKAQVETK